MAAKKTHKTKAETLDHSIPHNRRRHGRIRIVDVTTDFGDLVDLSPSGMRVRMNARPVMPGSVVNCAIDGHEGSVLVQAKAIWNRDAGDGTWEVGFVFLKLTDAAKKGIAEIARYTTSTLPFTPPPVPDAD